MTTNQTKTKGTSSDSEFLGKAPVGKLMWQLAIPAITAQVINMLYNIVDRVYIGHIAEVGALALTGVGVCSPIIVLVSAFAAFVSMGGAPRASISMGRGDDKGAEQILGSCFVFQICVSVILTIILLLFNRPLLMAFGASDNTIGYAVSYMNIYAIGTIFVQLTLGMNAFVTAQGFAKLSMYTVLIGAICNIVLDPIFIFVLNMGVSGAALATILSQAISCVWVLHILTSGRSELKLKKEYFRFNWRMLAPCLALGLSPFIMQGSESILNICFNSSLQRYGGDVAVGAMTILSTVMSFALMPLQGLAQGAQPITSYNFGAGKADRVKQSFKILVIASFAYSLLLWAFVQFFPQIFVGLFTTSAELIDFTVPALRIYTAALLIMGIQIACQMTFVSIGNAKSSIIVAIMRKFIILIPLIYILPNFFADKTFAVYLAEPIADTCAVIFTIILFAFEFRKALKKLREESARPGIANR